MSNRVQLVIPGLFDLPLQELEPGFVDSALPVLNRFLGRSRALPNRDYTVDAILRAALALPGSDEGLPVAAACAEDQDDAGRLMLIEAIHLQADMHSAIALPIPGNEQTRGDIDLLFDELAGLFEADLELIKGPGDARLLKLRQFDPPTHYPHPLSILGKSVNPYVEQSRQILPWYQLLNEMQMFLHQHPVNERRQREGQLAINSIWAWGAGNPVEGMEALRWYCDDPVLNRFASQLGLDIAPCNALMRPGASADCIVVELRLLRWLKSRLDAPLETLLLDIENRLFVPAMQAMRAGKGEVRLRAGFQCDFEQGCYAGLQFWRRPKSLAGLQQTGEQD